MHNFEQISEFDTYKKNWLHKFEKNKRIKIQQTLIGRYDSILRDNSFEPLSKMGIKILLVKPQIRHKLFKSNSITDEFSSDCSTSIIF